MTPVETEELIGGYLMIHPKIKKYLVPSKMILGNKLLQNTELI